MAADPNESELHGLNPPPPSAPGSGSGLTWQNASSRGGGDTARTKWLLEKTDRAREGEEGATQQSRGTRNVRETRRLFREMCWSLLAEFEN